MPRQTQTYPKTLIDLLQLKDVGPFQIEDAYRGVIPLIDILGNERVTTFTGTTATIVSGTAAGSLSLTIPSDEVWVMVGLGCELVLPNAGDVGQCWLEHTRQSRRSSVLAVSAKQTATIANERVPVGFPYPRPISLNRGDFLTARFMYSGAGTANAELRAEFYQYGAGSAGSVL